MIVNVLLSFFFFPFFWGVEKVTGSGRSAGPLLSLCNIYPLALYPFSPSGSVYIMCNGAGKNRSLEWRMEQWAGWWVGLGCGGGGYRIFGCI